MKFCINCKNCDIREEKALFLIKINAYYCQYPKKNERYHLVTGEKYHLMELPCGECRMFEKLCGAEGKWYEDKLIGNQKER